MDTALVSRAPDDSWRVRHTDWWYCEVCQTTELEITRLYHYHKHCRGCGMEMTLVGRDRDDKGPPFPGGKT